MNNLDKAKKALEFLQSMDDVEYEYNIIEAKILLEGFIRSSEIKEDE
jgi:hypothetical protein